MDNDQQIQEIFNYKNYLQQSFGIILDEETAAKLWIVKYAAIWRMVQNRSVSRQEIGEFRLNNYSLALSHYRFTCLTQRRSF